MTLLESEVASLFPLPVAPVTQQQQLEARAWKGKKGLFPGLVEQASCLEHHKAVEAGTWQCLGSLVEVAFAPNNLTWWTLATGTEHKASQRVNGWQGKEGRPCKDGFLPVAVHCTWHRGACTHPEGQERGKGRVPQPGVAKLLLQVQLGLRLLLLVEYWQVVVLLQAGVAVPAWHKGRGPLPSSLPLGPWTSMATFLADAVAVGFAAAQSRS